MYTPSDTRLEWLGEGPLFKSDSNKHWRTKSQPLFQSFPGPLLKSGMGPLARHDNHQKIISRRLEQMYTSSDTRLEWPMEGMFCAGAPDQSNLFTCVMIQDKTKCQGFSSMMIRA